MGSHKKLEAEAEANKKFIKKEKFFKDTLKVENN